MVSGVAVVGDGRGLPVKFCGCSSMSGCVDGVVPICLAKVPVLVFFFCFLWLVVGLGSSVVLVWLLLTVAPLAVISGPTWRPKKIRISLCLYPRSALYSFWACLNAGLMFVSHALSWWVDCLSLTSNGTSKRFARSK